MRPVAGRKRRRARRAPKKAPAKEIPKDYQRARVEKKWQDYWDKKKVFHFDPKSEKPIFSVDNPPRYASGGLHAGHAVHYTHIDFAARHHGMKGYNVHFPLCFDVNGIPIEVQVERKYNVSPKTIGRQKFNDMCMKFALSNIDKMTRQFKILGHSMDPSIFYQTASKNYRRLTQLSFIRLYEQGNVYKGNYPVNWCPRCHTALADAEVEHKKKMSSLNTLTFKVEELSEEEKAEHGEFIQIATTRPELLCTCHLVAIHPQDEKNRWLLGKKVTTPVFDRTISVIEDEKVDPEFGSGMVMICTIGDKNDLDWALKYKLTFEMAIDENGYMTDQAGSYKGLLVGEARAKIIEDLKESGRLLESKPIEQQAGVCWRCSTVVEFLKHPQWFLEILPFKKEVLEKSDEIGWFPNFMKIRLEEWVNSLQWDWVISRQRYFATPIPLWECENCGEVVPAREQDCYVDPTRDDPPHATCPACIHGKLIGCTDVFDTWMDSSITPLYNCYWERDEELFQRMWPASLRPQSHDIIRTWAFYTILRSHLLTGEKPWDTIMMDGFILSPDGTPMHTSKGNVIDPLEALKKHGTDALRYYASTCAVGSDNAFRWQDLVRGERFTKKFWNLQRFIGGALEAAKKKRIKYQNFKLGMESLTEIEDRWILTLYSRLIRKASEDMDNYRFDRALKEIEYFLWHELADDYVEMVKHRIYKAEETAVFACLHTIGLGLAKLLAPLFPHVTEEVYQRFYVKSEKWPKDKVPTIHKSGYPEFEFEDEDAETNGAMVKEIIKSIRAHKSETGLALNAELPKVLLIGADATWDAAITIQRTVNAYELEFVGSEAVHEELVAFVPDFSKLGPLFKARSREVGQAIKDFKPQGMSVEDFQKAKKFKFTLPDGEEVSVSKDVVSGKTGFVAASGEEGTMLRAGDVGIFVLKVGKES